MLFLLTKPLKTLQNQISPVGVLEFLFSRLMFVSEPFKCRNRRTINTVTDWPQNGKYLTFILFLAPVAKSVLSEINYVFSRRMSPLVVNPSIVCATLYPLISTPWFPHSTLPRSLPVPVRLAMPGPCSRQSVYTLHLVFGIQRQSWCEVPLSCHSCPELQRVLSGLFL